MLQKSAENVKKENHLDHLRILTYAEINPITPLLSGATDESGRDER